MQLQSIPGNYAVCRLSSLDGLRTDGVFFLARTEDELSLVCSEDRIPPAAEKIERGWRMLRVSGALDFSLTGILAQLAGTLADAGIPIFAVSTYDTDYLLIKAAHCERAVTALTEAGHSVVPGPVRS